MWNSHTLHTVTEYFYQCLIKKKSSLQMYVYNNLDVSEWVSEWVITASVDNSR
jgi:hypothetical protein